MAAPLLQVDHLTKTFPGALTPSVNDISFTLNEGEVVGVLGPNGAGKTTTIQMLLGTTTITGGSISYFGKDFAKHRSESLQHIGFATTYVGLPRQLTVKECLKIFAYLTGIPDATKNLQEMISLFQLSDIQHRYSESLSTGQRARVMLAKAFLSRPRIVILDEPTASLDPDISHAIRDIILQMQKQYKTSILFTSHNMEEVTEVCDRVLVLKQGKIIANDTPENLAKTVSKARVHLVVLEGIERLYAYAQQRNMLIVATDRLIEMEMDESEISQFLTHLAQSGVTYSHISIEKPTLEDYFLRIAHS